MDKESLRKYADVVIEVGINLYKGQCLNVVTGPANYDFALLLAESAYKKGAKYVNIQVNSNKLAKTRINNTENQDDLSFVPQFDIIKSFEQLGNDWGNIRIDSTEELDVLQDVDSTKLGMLTKGVRTALKRYSDEMMKHKHPWCVICAPGPKWADQVLNTNGDPKAVDMLWEKLIPILRLDKADPVKAWKEHNEKLINLCEKLNSKQFDKLIFKTNKTNLEVGLNPTSIWIGGPAKTSEGILFNPNLPTEEVFTTPDYRRTNGKVVSTRPVKVLEAIVEGAWFEFKNGSIVNFGADKGKDILDKYLKIDSGSSYFGEIALVDSKSPIFQSGLIFSSILYDENASSHFALGNAYPSCLSNGHSLTNDDEKRKAGCNVSVVHTDFMFGSTEMDIIGVDRNGKESPIMKSGEFVI